MSRQSNFELLRILAMLFVLILHTTYSVFDFPKGHLVQAAPFSWLGIILTAQATVCAVNTFVLITGMVWHPLKVDEPTPFGISSTLLLRTHHLRRLPSQGRTPQSEGICPVANLLLVCQFLPSALFAFTRTQCFYRAKRRTYPAPLSRRLVCRHHSPLACRN